MTIWIPSLPREPSRPIYRAIADALESDVVAGRLQPGERLPTHRELAARLQVTVGTVSRAYATARRAGWISGEIGRGTFVLDRGAARFPVPGGEAPEVSDLGLNVPVEDPAPDLGDALRALAAREDLPRLLGYAGDAANDRRAGAVVLERHGLAVDPDRVILCAGAQHAIGVALEVLTRPGDCVLAEELTYPGFRPVAEARGLRIGPVPLDERGIVPRALDAACRKLRPRALYLVPTLHNPTARTLDATRRAELVEVARRHDLTILEDDVYRLLQAEVPHPIARLAPERTIYITSLSKSFVPGLRVGYLAGPPNLTEALLRAVHHSMWMPSPVTAALATLWVSRGELDAISAGKRREAAARQELARRVLPREHCSGERAGYHLWLATPTSAEAFALAARERGVLVVPSSAFHLGSGPPPRFVRVSTSAPRDRSTLAGALERLREVLEGSGTLPPRL